MTRKGLSNLFVLGILTCGVCGFVFNSNGGIVTICVFLGWVFFMAALAFRMKKTLVVSLEDEEFSDEQSWYGSAEGIYWGAYEPNRK